MDVWLCEHCRKEFDSELEATEHEKDCLKDILAQEEEKERQRKEKREKEQKEAKKREKERLERYEKREKERKEIAVAQAKKEKEYQDLLEKDRLNNPHLAIISDHLWWLALMAQIALALLISQFIVIFFFFLSTVD